MLGFVGVGRGEDHVHVVDGGPDLAVRRDRASSRLTPEPERAGASVHAIGRVHAEIQLQGGQGVTGALYVSNAVPR